MRRLVRLVLAGLLPSLSACASGQTPREAGPVGVPAIGEPLPPGAQPMSLPAVRGVRGQWGGVYRLTGAPFLAVADHGTVAALATRDPAVATPDGVRPGDPVSRVRAVPGAVPDGESQGLRRLRLPSGWVAALDADTVASILWEGAAPEARAWPGRTVPALGAPPPAGAWALDDGRGGPRLPPFRVAIDAAHRIAQPVAVVLGAREGRVVALAAVDARVRTPEGARLGLSDADALALAAGEPEPMDDGGLRIPLASGWVAVLPPSRLLVTRLVWERPGPAPGIDGVSVGDPVPEGAQEIAPPYTPGATRWPESVSAVVQDGVGYVLGLRGGRVEVVQVASPGFATPDGIGPGTPVAEALAVADGEPEPAGRGLRRLRLPSGWDALVRDGESVVYRVSREKD